MSRPNNRLVVLETVQYRVYTPKPQPQPQPEPGFWDGVRDFVIFVGVMTLLTAAGFVISVLPKAGH